MREFYRCYCKFSRLVWQQERITKATWMPWSHISHWNYASINTYFYICQIINFLTHCLHRFMTFRIQYYWKRKQIETWALQLLIPNKQYYHCQKTCNSKTRHKQCLLATVIILNILSILCPCLKCDKYLT